MDKPALDIVNLHASYGQADVLHGVSLHVRQGEVVALLGRNGAGRTTTLRSIMALVQRRRGSITVRGQETIGWLPHKIARAGVGFCPEERGIFSSLTCEENLFLTPKVSGGQPISVEEIYSIFPNLAERASSPGGRLSGGEQQMLAIARILRAGSKILLLDEISEGLAPVIVQSLAELVLQLKRRGYTILLVEQNFHFAAPLADRFYVMENGRVAEALEARDISSKSELVTSYLSV